MTLKVHKNFNNKMIIMTCMVTSAHSTNQLANPLERACTLKKKNIILHLILRKLLEYPTLLHLPQFAFVTSKPSVCQGPQQFFGFSTRKRGSSQIIKQPSLCPKQSYKVTFPLVLIYNTNREMLVCLFSFEVAK